MQNNLKKSSFDTPMALAERIVEVLYEKKGLEIRAFDVTGRTSVTDVYVNVTGRSGTQVRSLADEVEEKLSEEGVFARGVEGKRGNSWILVDFGDVILNVFDKEARSFYSFDRHLPEECEVDLSHVFSAVEKKLGF